MGAGGKLDTNSGVYNTAVSQAQRWRWAGLSVSQSRREGTVHDSLRLPLKHHPRTALVRTSGTGDVQAGERESRASHLRAHEVTHGLLTDVGKPFCESVFLKPVWIRQQATSPTENAAERARLPAGWMCASEQPPEHPGCFRALLIGMVHRRKQVGELIV